MAMAKPRRRWYFSGIADNPAMKPDPLLNVAFREVRHDLPDDCLHHEPVEVRGQEMDWTIPAHRHESLHQFQWLARGTLRGAIDGRTFEARGPVLMLTAPGSVHGFTYSRDIHGDQVTLPTATLQRLLGGSDLVRSLSTSFVVQGEAAAAVAGEAQRLFDGIAREYAGDAPGRVHALLAQATMLAVMFLRLRDAQHAQERPRAARDTLVQRYRALIEANFRTETALGFYARELGVSPDHLSRSCRNIAGQSAQELLHERLMLEARRLLAYSAAPVAEIAAQLGYGDPAYFSKFFAKQVGETPSGYRAMVARGVKGLEPA
jgi:AraC family transcriptional activator of pobA